MPEFKKPEDEIGALWIKTSSQGREYFTGDVNGERIIVFRNDRKEPGSKRPDFSIRKAKPRPDDAGLPHGADTPF